MNKEQLLKKLFEKVQEYEYVSMYHSEHKHKNEALFNKGKYLGITEVMEEVRKLNNPDEENDQLFINAQFGAWIKTQHPITYRLLFSFLNEFNAINSFER